MTPRHKILVLFGTRPEAIKLAPVIRMLRANERFAPVTVSSSQHTDLLKPFLRIFDIAVDHDLKVMTANQTPNQVLGRIVSKLDKLLDKETPDLILVQGDTATTLAGALAGFNRKIPVGHVEAGLRSGDLHSPFPEEMNRRLVSQVATYHFAATERNRRNLLAENVPSDKIFVTGNPVVDALGYMQKNLSQSERVSQLLSSLSGQKIVLLTTHRRESFGEVMTENLRVLRDFIAKHQKTALVFPVHPNPNVKKAAQEMMKGYERVHLIDPLDYGDFVSVMKRSWLIVSDSGGVQEEAPSLGKPVLILRENTERPEAVRAGVAKLVGGRPKTLARLLDENLAVDTWIRSVKEVANPFGDGKSAKRIVEIIGRELGAQALSAQAK
jgi:UDP-N-acetylglucosamine 2-epimerase (non-hydrolysing)